MGGGGAISQQNEHMHLFLLDALLQMNARNAPAPGTSPGAWDRPAEGLVGIGATLASAVSSDGLLIVTRVKSGCNAAALGIQAGDRILEISNTAVTTGQAARALILGQPGTFLEIVIKRGDSIKEFSVQRMRPCCIDAVRRDAILRRTAAAIMLSSTTACFEQWARHVEDVKERMRLLRKAVAKVMRAKVAAAFFSWQIMARNLNCSRSIVHKVFSRLTMAKLVAAFETWAEHKRNIDSARESAKKVISRILCKFKSSAFDSWRGATVRYRRHRAVLSRAAMHWKNSSRAGAIASWLLYTADQRNAKQRALMLEIEAQKERRCKESASLRVTKHWKFRTLSKVLRAWGFKKHESARARALCKRAALRMLRSRTARAFSTWSEKVFDRLRYKVCAQYNVVAAVDCFSVYLKAVRLAHCPAKCRSNAEGAVGSCF
jgi:hypothetical protein